MHLLIVDDGRYVVEYLKHLLNWAKFGVHRIETTTNPTEARIFAGQRPVRHHDYGYSHA